MLFIEGDRQASMVSIIDVNDICRGWKCLTSQISAVLKPKLQFKLQLLCSLLNPLTLLLLSLWIWPRLHRRYQHFILRIGYYYPLSVEAKAYFCAAWPVLCCKRMIKVTLKRQKKPETYFGRLILPLLSPLSFSSLFFVCRDSWSTQHFRVWKSTQSYTFGKQKTVLEMRNTPSYNGLSVTGAVVGTDLQQLQIVQIQRALRSSSLHHVQVVKALLSISWKTHTWRPTKSSDADQNTHKHLQVWLHGSQPFQKKQEKTNKNI